MMIEIHRNRPKDREMSFDEVQKAVTRFNDMCADLHPVLHHFFYENFKDPCVWLERRLAYARTLATTSIVGYTLGIGDRNLTNILIDKNTAELIHIDFGVALDQGEVKGTPEKVPFRLTR